MKSNSSTPRFATVGTFDGVHTGHASVVNELRNLAMERGFTPTVFTLRTHPLELINPLRSPASIMTLEEKISALEKLEVEVITIDFTEEIRAMKSEQFMQDVLLRQNVRGLLVGYDNRFGSDRDATISHYVEVGQRLGIEVCEAACVEGVSSSDVRQLLYQGDVKESARKLGRFFSLTGIVAHGKQLGRTIGFPTANVEPSHASKIIPANGVYAALAEITGDNNLYGAVVNIGTRPTVDVDCSKRSIEAYILDFNGDIYSREVTLRFVERIRREQRFANLEELRDAIGHDVDIARGIFSEYYQHDLSGGR